MLVGFLAPGALLLLHGHWLLLLQWALLVLVGAACWRPDDAFSICSFLAACAQHLLKGPRWLPPLSGVCLCTLVTFPCIAIDKTGSHTLHHRPLLFMHV